MLTTDFMASQQYGLPEIINLQDSSTGSDGTIVNRKVYFQLANGKYLTASGVSDTIAYINWAYSSASQSFNVLPVDESVAITVAWCNNSGTAVYTKTKLYTFTLYSEQFSLDLTRAISSAPMIMQDSDYWLNKIKLRVNIDDAGQATDVGGDQFLAQAALDRAQYMISNQSYFF